MNKIRKEIINQYLDGELDYDERKTTEKLLEDSSEDKNEYLLLNRLDKNLRKMKSKKPSQDFTFDLMNKLSVKTATHKIQSRFIMGIITILMLPILLITWTVIYNSFSNYSAVGSSIIYTIKSNISLLLGNAINYLSISPVSLLWISLSLILSIAIYFLFEDFSRSKFYLDKIR